MLKNEDIEVLISELERVKRDDEDPKQCKIFVSQYAGDIVDLLGELLERRGKAAAEHAALIRKNVHRTLVEGYSEDNIHEAFSHALSKASVLFSEDHDVTISVVGLLDLPKGGHRATLEVQTTPIKLGFKKYVKESDKAQQYRKDKEEKELERQEESYYLQHLVLEHFVHHSASTQSIPDHLLIHIHEADILHKMIEKEFFIAAHHDDHDEPAPTPNVVFKPSKYEIDSD